VLPRIGATKAAPYSSGGDGGGFLSGRPLFLDRRSLMALSPPPTEHPPMLIRVTCQCGHTGEQRYRLMDGAAQAKRWTFLDQARETAGDNVCASALGGWTNTATDSAPSTAIAPASAKALVNEPLASTI
jgi:hypothetical protein